MDSLTIRIGYLQFRKTAKSDSGLTDIWTVLSNEDECILGQIQWFGRWRRYAFYPEPKRVFEKVCLRTLADFCDQATVDHRRRRSDEKKAHP